MKKTGVLLCIIILIFSLSGCNILLGGTVLETLGVKFTSQIEMIEECLSIDLGDITDNSIKRIYSYTEPDGNYDLSIQCIPLEGSGNLITSELSKSDNWSVLPYDESIEKLFLSNNVYENYDFKIIENGYYTISGISENNDFYDFDRNNFESWHTYEIGIWDSNDEILYYISITNL